MNPEKFQFLSLRHLPGRFTAQEAAWYLGFSVEDIPCLTKARLLKPTGDPSPKASKIFSFSQLRRLHNSDPWIHKATSKIYRKTETKNEKDRRKRKRKS